MSWNWQKPKWPDFIYNAKDFKVSGAGIPAALR